jgi:hypothetical protein
MKMLDEIQMRPATMTSALRLSLAGALALALWMGGAAGAAADTIIGERPAVETHLDQAEIDAGNVTLDELIDHGELLFTARFNALDGQGRPASTGTGAPRVPDEPAFIRTSGPDNNSCGECHNNPGPGGSGEFGTAVFVGASALDPVTFSVGPEASNERNTVGMNGSGPIEMLAREMSEQLIAIRDSAKELAADSGNPVTLPLSAKGVSFGSITALPSGKIDPSGIDGVDWDLMIKPFHQKGAVVSLRQFTNNAMNHHFGIQAVEPFGENLDPDMDGITNELTVGDVTAAALFQASLPIPVVKLPPEPERRQAVKQGQRLFSLIQCSSCHIPSMVLDDRHFSEPSPFNPPGNLRPGDVPAPFTYDMTAEGPTPRLQPAGDGAIVKAFTDLKRHDLCDEDYDHYCNEQLAQGSLLGFARAADFTVPGVPRPTREFLTRKLWDVGNSDPYGHRGDLTTITEAISEHGGEARGARDAFFGLTQDQRNAVVEFLKSLQVL